MNIKLIATLLLLIFSTTVLAIKTVTTNSTTHSITTKIILNTDNLITLPIKEVTNLTAPLPLITHKSIIKPQNYTLFDIFDLSDIPIKYRYFEIKNSQQEQIRTQLSHQLILNTAKNKQHTLNLTHNDILNFNIESGSCNKVKGLKQEGYAHSHLNNPINSLPLKNNTYNVTAVYYKINSNTLSDQPISSEIEATNIKPIHGQLN